MLFPSISSTLEYGGKWSPSYDIGRPPYRIEILSGGGSLSANGQSFLASDVNASGAILRITDSANTVGAVQFTFYDPIPLIPDLYSRYQPENSSYKSDGSRAQQGELITEWKDLTSNANHLSNTFWGAAPNSYEPIYETSGINGLPSIECQQNNAALQSAGQMGTTNKTFIAVAKLNSPAFQYAAIVGTAQPASNDPILFFSPGTYLIQSHGDFTVGLGETKTIIPNDNPVISGNPFIVALTRSTASTAQVLSVCVWSRNFPGITVAFDLAASVGEILYFTRDLTTNEVAKAMRYLQAKYHIGSLE